TAAVFGSSSPIYAVFGSLLTTKFGNFSIRDGDKIEAESKMEVVLETEQGSAKVRICYDRDRQSPSWTRLAD
ncbi:Os01g0392800, partial [Oryza sativa Japonica Group]